MADRITATFEDILASLDATIRRLSAPDAQGDPDAKSEKKYFERQRRAYAKAQLHYLNGRRPTATDSGWLVPSSDPSGPVYRVSRQGAVLMCDCPAGENETLCWHKVACEVAELADDRAELYVASVAADPAPVLPPVPAAPSLRLVPRDMDDDVGYADMLAAA